MKFTLRRHGARLDVRYLALRSGGNIFIMPKFKHLMMDNELIQVEIPEDYYRINKEAIDEMASNTNKFICNLIEKL